MKNLRVLIVEDDTGIMNALCDVLEYEGAIVDKLYCGSNAVEVVRKTEPDFLILDLMLPKDCGFVICQEIREFSNMPIMILTARMEEDQRVKGLNSGADDYVCKPFYPKEIVARISTIMRRADPTKKKNENKISYESIALYPERYICEVNNESIQLTVIEFNILHIMISKPSVIFSRESLIVRARLDAEKIGTRSIDNHIKNIRKKINKHSKGREFLHSVYRAGYKFE